MSVYATYILQIYIHQEMRNVYTVAVKLGKNIKLLKRKLDAAMGKYHFQQTCVSYAMPCSAAPRHVCRRRNVSFHAWHRSLEATRRMVFAKAGKRTVVL